jgi:hypothetical protein
MRHDTVRLGVYSAGIVVLFIVGVYLILFNVISPHFWDNYWLLAGTRWGVTILGNIPLTEMLWYLSWILFGSMSYPFASGRTVSAQQKIVPNFQGNGPPLRLSRIQLKAFATSPEKYCPGD